LETLEVPQARPRITPLLNNAEETVWFGRRKIWWSGDMEGSGDGKLPTKPEHPAVSISPGRMVQKVALLQTEVHLGTNG